MTKPDQEPFWQPPEDYSKLPNFDELFPKLIRFKQQYPDEIRGYNYDRNKLRDFLRNLDNNNDPNSQTHVGYSEWLEVYTTLKDSITEEATAKTLLHITEEMEKWRLKFPAYAQHYWGIDHDENR